MRLYHGAQLRRGACEAIACDIDYQSGASGHVFVGFEVTVECPNGDQMGSSGQVDVDSVVDNPIERVWDEIERMADELCGQCSSEERPFNVV